MSCTTGRQTDSTRACPTAAPRRRRPRRLLAVASVVAAAAGLAACGSGSAGSGAASGGRNPASAGGGGAAAPARRAHVTIENFAFDPADLTVMPGATVTITNHDSVAHTFTARDGAFGTGQIAPGTTATVTAPTRPGTYPYYCTIHQFMTGVLTVASG